MTKKVGPKLISAFLVLCLVFITIPVLVLGGAEEQDAAPVVDETTTQATERPSSSSAANGSDVKTQKAAIDSQQALQQAIDRAADGQTIALEGDIQITGQPISLPQDKQLTIEGKNRTLRLAGNYTGRHLSATGGEQGRGLTIRNLTLQGHNDEQTALEKRKEGGGLELNRGAGEVQLSHVTFVGNHSKDRGGAIAMQATKLILKESKFMNNVAKEGGALFHDRESAVVSSKTTFEGNRALGDGGAIYAQGTMNLEENTFQNNAAGQKNNSGSGGALYFTQTKHQNHVNFVAINRGGFWNNRAADRGGAIYNGSQIADLEPVQMGGVPAQFGGNIAPLGGDWVVPFSTNANLTYDFNDGQTATSQAQSHIKGQVSLATLEELSWQGLTPPTDKMFGGWNTAADGSGVNYLPGEAIDLQADLTLFARWADIRTVAFEGNGGSIAPQTIQVADGLPVAEPTAQREGATLLGYLIKDSSQQWNFNDPVTGDLTLVAMWNVNKYTVLFDSNGGYVNPPHYENVEHGSTIPTPSYSRDGYNFVGFNVQGTGLTWDFNNPVTGNMTLVAMWEQPAEPPAPTPIVPPAPPTPPSNPTPMPPVNPPTSISGGGGAGGSIVAMGPVEPIAGTDLAPVMLPELENGKLKTVTLSDEDLEAAQKAKRFPWQQEHWGLVDVILFGICALGTLILFIVYILGRDEDSELHGTKLTWPVLSVIVTLMAAVGIVLTQDFSFQMVIADLWAIALAPLALAQTVFLVMSLRMNRKEREQERRRQEEIERRQSGKVPVRA